MAHHPYKFPYTPYPQQLSLMNEIYSALNDSSVLLAESPTGTGQILSLLLLLLFITMQGKP